MARVVSWRKLRFRFDWTLTAAAAAVASLGLMNLWSAVHDRSSGLFTQQISWFALGTVAFLAVASLDYRTISRYALRVLRRRRRAADRHPGLRQDGQRRAALVRSRPGAPAAVGDDAGADHRRARQVPERFAGAGGAIVPPSRVSRRDRQRAGVADRQATRLRDGVPVPAHLHHHHADRAPEAEDAGRDPGPGGDRGVPDLPAPAARVSAQARSSRSSTSTPRAPTRRARR